jgi:hypothetical protein
VNVHYFLSVGTLKLFLILIEPLVVPFFVHEILDLTADKDKTHATIPNHFCRFLLRDEVVISCI